MSMKARLGDYIQEYSVRNRAEEDIPVYSVTNTQGFCQDYFGKEVASKDKSTYKVVPKGCFAYNPSRINVGSVDWQRYEDRVIVSPLYNVFSVAPQLDQQYLYYYLKSDFALQRIKAVATGSVRDNLKLTMLFEFPINLPSMEVQKEIVKKLDGVKRVISLREQEMQTLDDLIKARFVEMFGKPESDEKYPQIAIKDFTDVISGGTPDRKNNEYWENGTVPWVKTTELQNTRINTVEECITEKGLNESAAKVVPEDTVLIAMYGQGKTRGMTAILGIPASTNQACACILPCEEVEPKYLWQYMIMSYDRLRNQAQGGNQPNLNGNMIKNFTVLVPPKELQSQFVQFVEQVDKSKVAVQKALDEAQVLFDSLMQKFFG